MASAHVVHCPSFSVGRAIASAILAAEAKNNAQA
jgi:hypothetical protein